MKTVKRRGNVLYLQSGGPTAVINTSLLGAYETFQKLYDGKFYISRYGISSLIDGLIEELKGDLFKLRNTPSSYTGSARIKLKDDPKDKDVLKIISTIKTNDISVLLLNGGNDSMDSAEKLSRFFKIYDVNCQVFGIPKTVDDDLKGCDHTPGYPTAAKFVANCTIALTLDEYAYKKGKILILECMGRDSGFLTASSLLAKDRGLKPDYIYIPEMEFDIDSFMNKAMKTYDKKGHCVIVVSEGIRDKEGKLIAYTGKIDNFGNHIMGGVAYHLSSLLKERGYPTRAIEFNMLGRCSSYLLSKVDSKEAYKAGEDAIRHAYKGESGYMIGNIRISNNPYRLKNVLVPLNVPSSGVSTIDKKFIVDSQGNIDDSFLDYLRPLIKGEVKTIASDGLLDII